MSEDIQALLFARLRACRARLGQVACADVVVQGYEGDRAVQGLERELATGDRARLTEEARRLLRALCRLEHGDYGRCDDCGADIAPARLAALPDVERCRACQERHEADARARLHRDRPPAPPGPDSEDLG